MFFLFLLLPPFKCFNASQQVYVLLNIFHYFNKKKYFIIMPPFAKSNISVIIFNIDKSEKSFYEESLSFLIDVCSVQWFCYPKDSTKLLLINTSDDENCLHIPHMTEAFTNFVAWNPKKFKQAIQETEYVENKVFWLDAIKVGLSLLEEEIALGGNIISRQLILVTNKFFSLDNSQSIIKDFMRKQFKLNVRIIIAGPRMQVGFIRNNDELEHWRKHPQFLDSIDDISLATLVTLCQKSNSIVCDLKMARDLVFSFRDEAKKQPWNEPLSIGDNLTIPTSAFRILIQKSLASVTNAKKFDSNFVWVKADDETKEICHNDIIVGISRWGKFISFEKNVLEFFKPKDSRNFTILGFTDEKHIKESYYIGNGTHVLAANQKIPNAEKFVYLFYKTLLENNKVAIASKTYYARCRPKLMALVPDKKLKIIWMNEIPYSHHFIRNWKEIDPYIKENDDDKDNNIEEIQVYDFVNLIKVPSNRQSNNTDIYRLNPHLTYNPLSVIVARRLAEKYTDNNLHVDITLPELPRSEFEEHFPITAKKKNTSEYSLSSTDLELIKQNFADDDDDDLML